MDVERRVEFRRIVIKDDTERLRAELKRARPQLTEAEVNVFTREELVEEITDLRLRTGDTRAIRNPIDVPVEGAVGGVIPEVGRPVEVMPHVEPTQALMQMMLIMKREEGDKETRRIEEDRRRVELEEKRIQLEREKEEKRLEREEKRAEEERKIRREELLALQLKEEKRLELEREKEEKRMQFERERVEEERKLRREEILAQQRNK